MEVIGRCLSLVVVGMIAYMTVKFSIFIGLMFRSLEFRDGYKTEIVRIRLARLTYVGCAPLLELSIVIKHSAFRNDKLSLYRD